MLREAKRAVSWRFICDSEKLIDVASMKPEAVSLEQILSQQMKHTIENAAAALDTDKMCQAVDAVFHKFRGIRRGDPWVLYEFCFYMETVIRMSLKNSKINLEIKEGILSEGSYYDLENFCICMKRQVEGIFEKLRTESRENDNRPIRIAKQYISEHYMEPVRLTEIAELVHMNAAYFSTVFKKETGISFSDYVTEQRMEAAKGLLQGSSLSISEIAERVGYTETAYFSRLFKKQVGIKPSQYRNLHS